MKTIFDSPKNNADWILFLYSVSSTLKYVDRELIEYSDALGTNDGERIRVCIYEIFKHAVG